MLSPPEADQYQTHLLIPLGSVMPSTQAVQAVYSAWSLLLVRQVHLHATDCCRSAHVQPGWSLEVICHFNFSGQYTSIWKAKYLLEKQRTSLDFIDTRIDPFYEHQSTAVTVSSCSCWKGTQKCSWLLSQRCARRSDLKLDPHLFPWKLQHKHKGAQTSPSPPSTGTSVRQEPCTASVQGAWKR